MASMSCMEMWWTLQVCVVQVPGVFVVCACLCIRWCVRWCRRLYVWCEVVTEVLSCTLLCPLCRVSTFRMWGGL